MARASRKLRAMRRAMALSVWLYGLLLRAYPATFRHAYRERMVRVFHDSCHAALQQRGLPALFPLWFYTLSDLVVTAYLERWHVLKEKGCVMAMSRYSQNFPLRLRIAIVATVIAFAVSLVASLNLYLLEDTSSLTQAAYSASSLLRFSYDGVYLSALAAAVAICAIIGYAMVQRTLLVIIGLIIVTLLVAFGGFGGLLIRHATTFLLFFVVFCLLLLIGLLLGRAVAARMVRFLEQRSAAILGACVSVGSLLLVNIIALILHTLILNPVSHALYMQGQIGGTHLNFTLIAMGIAPLTLIACIVCLGLALRSPSQQS